MPRFRPTVIALTSTLALIVIFCLVIVLVVTLVAGPENIPPQLWAVISGCITPIPGFVTLLITNKAAMDDPNDG